MQGARLLHVVPRKATGLSGNLETVNPVLDTVITIEPKERTSYALIEEICNKISIATNTHVVFGTISINMLTLTKTSVGGSGKTGRSILEQGILERRPARLSACFKSLAVIVRDGHPRRTRRAGAANDDLNSGPRAMTVGRCSKSVDETNLSRVRRQYRKI